MRGQLYGEEAAAVGFETFLDLLREDAQPAIRATDGRRDMTYANLLAALWAEWTAREMVYHTRLFPAQYSRRAATVSGTV